MKKTAILVMLCVIAPFISAQGIADSPGGTQVDSKQSDSKQSDSTLSNSTLSGNLRGDDSLLPLNRVVILTSGLAYYEHSGNITGNAALDLPFRLDAVNDALKTLIINDPSSANPSVTYQSENTLIQTLRSLSIDLSDSPNMATILSRLRGAEVEISSSSVSSITGRITGIEYRPSAGQLFTGMNEPWLILSARNGIMSFNLNEITNIKFTDPVIEQDLNRSLDLIASSRNTNSRQLLVNLPGTGSRNVSLSYVIPSPVWKVSYRLDLGSAQPLFQGWAIVDNDSDTDWINVELSLVAGRPVSFIQRLYPPYYVSRPVLPLSIAGTAEASVYDRSYAITEEKAEYEQVYMMNDSMERSRSSVMQAEIPSYAPSPSANLASGGTMQTAAGSDAGGQFEFTIRNPVSLARRMSAMFPLVESPVEAKATLIYSGSGRYPKLGAEITNTTGMKLPAGPVTVYDGGVYAGDALLEFWNDNEKRLISFGEDLSVTAAITDASLREVSSVTVSGGVMIITRNWIYNKTYAFINSSAVSKPLIIEHNKTSQTDLVSPAVYEQTTSAYRFNLTLPANRETSFTVSEKRPVSERITLLSLRTDSILSYATNQEIPSNVRAALQRAVELKQAVDAADAAARDIETQRSRLISDQDRIRRNLEAAGSQTPQGQDYLTRLVSLDKEIDDMVLALQNAQAQSRTAQQAYESYINGVNLQ